MGDDKWPLGMVLASYTRRGCSHTCGLFDGAVRLLVDGNKAYFGMNEEVMNAHS